jgi:hypothetical protein
MFYKHLFLLCQADDGVGLSGSINNKFNWISNKAQMVTKRGYLFATSYALRKTQD